MVRLRVWHGKEASLEAKNLRCRLTARISRIGNEMAWTGAVSRGGLRHGRDGRRRVEVDTTAMMGEDTSPRRACQKDSARRAHPIEEGADGDVAVRVIPELWRMGASHPPQRARDGTNESAACATGRPADRRDVIGQPLGRACLTYCN